MAYIDTLGAAGRGVAQGALDFNTFMQSTANVNQLLANDKQRELMQGIAMPGLQLPTVAASPIVAPAPPAVAGNGVGLITGPRLDPAGVAPSWQQFQQFTGVPSAAPATASPGGVIKLTGKVDELPSRNPGPFKDYYPDANVFGVSPNNNVLQNTAAKIGNSVYNFPGNVLNVSANLIEDPLKNLGAALLKPEGVAPAAISTNIERGSVPVAGAASPSATSPASGAPSTAGAPSSAAVGLSTSGGAAPASAVSSQAVEQFFPTTVRNEMLKASPEDMDYLQQQILAQRDEISRSANETLSLLQAQQQRSLAQTQQQISLLTQYAQAAQQAGNTGQMVRYREQADQLLAAANDAASQFEMQSLQLQQASRQQFLENDLKLWTQQAMRAEQEWMNSRDPTRMTQIMAAYGFPIAVEDAGGGKYRIVDITGDGQGKRRPTTFTAREIGDMFMSTLSEAFRAQKISEQSALQTEMMKHQFKLDEIDATSAGNILQEQVKQAIASGEYSAQTDAQGNNVLVPKYPSPDRPVIFIQGEPEVNPDGVAYGRISREYY